MNNLQIGHLQMPRSQFSLRYDSRSKHYKKHEQLANQLASYLTYARKLTEASLIYHMEPKS